MRSVPSRFRIPTAALALFGLALFAAPASLAAGPSNDEIAAATAITSLPFSGTVNTADATSSPGDLDCSGLEDTHTVWYSIRPSSDMRLGIRTDTEIPELSTSIASGSPGSLTFLQCSFASAQAFDAKAGTTYYIQLATAGAEPGGLVTISVQKVEPLTVALALSPTDDVSRAGVVTVGGMVRCSRPLPPGSEVVVQGTLTQGEAQGWLVPYHFPDGCSTTPMRWQTPVQVRSSVPFAAGPAELTATAFACDTFACAPNDTRRATVRLR